MIRVRLDGGFAAPEVLDFLDCQPFLEYAINMASNKVLDRLVEPAMRTARRLSKESGETEHTESSAIKQRRPGGISGASSIRPKSFAIHTGIRKIIRASS